MMKWREIRLSYSDRLTELQRQLARNPYVVLGLTEAATDDEVKAAYRRQVSSYHPDKQSEFLRSYGQEVTKILNAAYEQICERRKK